MTTRVRASKYRHIVATPFQLRDTYGDITTGAIHTESTVIHANSAFFAVPWAPTGSVCVVPLEKVGTVPEDTKLIYNLEDGDKTQINEIALCQQNSDLLATASNSGSVAVFRVPNGGALTADVTTAECRVQASEKRLLGLKWHPHVSSLLVSAAADKVMKLWDVSAGGQEIATLPAVHKGLITTWSWNGEGSLLATHCKDKKLRIFDPRANECVHEVMDHPSPKSSHVIWLSNADKLVTSGFKGGSERNLALWDPRNMSARLHTEKLDPSSSTMFLYTDEDTGTLYVAGKGDGSIRMYEADDEGVGLHFLSEYKSKTPQNGLCLLPKKVVNVMNCEILRMLKLSGTRVEPIRFEVPRAQNQFFQDDIFPDTWDLQPSCSAGEWASGSNGSRNRVSMNPEA